MRQGAAERTARRGAVPPLCHRACREGRRSWAAAVLEKNRRNKQAMAQDVRFGRSLRLSRMDGQQEPRLTRSGFGGWPTSRPPGCQLAPHRDRREKVYTHACAVSLQRWVRPGVGSAVRDLPPLNALSVFAATALVGEGGRGCVGRCMSQDA